MNSRKGNHKIFPSRRHITRLTLKTLAKAISVILVLGALILTPVLSFLFSDVTIRGSGSIAIVLPLHVEGRYIKDTFNHTIILRGINQPGFLDDPNGWWNPEGGGYLSGLGMWNPEAVKYNLDGMRDWGCNVIRLHTNVQWWLNNPDGTYRKHIKDTIAWAEERKMYVIFDFYSVQELTGQDPLPFPPYSLAGSETIIPDMTAFATVWRGVANELKGFPNIMFDLWNEPNGEGISDWFTAVQQCIDAIRDAGADQLIIVQWDYGIWCNLEYPPPNAATTMSWVETYPLNDPQGNIVYSFHNYRGDFHRTNGARVNIWEYEDIKLGLQYCLVDYVLNNLTKPVLCGEIGANMWESGEGLTHELAYFNNSLNIYNEWNISYLAWVWTIPAHMRHGLLQNGYPWLPPPNEAGEILIASLTP